MNKVIRIGKLEDLSVFCRIEFKDGRLSITGVVGPMKSGNALGSCGQIITGFAEYDRRGHTSVTNIVPASGWTVGYIRRFFDVWDRWHLNDMRAGTPKQEEWLRQHPIEVVYPESHYEKASKLLEEAGLNPDDGYRYGHAWLREEVPAEVLQFLADLPDADVQPAWC